MADVGTPPARADAPDFNVILPFDEVVEALGRT